VSFRTRFVWSLKATGRPGRSCCEMDCKHAGFHSIRTIYDRQRGVLVYFWTCESCGKRLDEARRESYVPQFDPQGNQRFLAAAS
jgi:hypothetical protein